ncbi:nucleotide exchange factor Sil1p [Trichomonascus vanleenenianus]|uniref:Sil1p n=1 Tax=Trichomonascus vanleenenianus TaxID=2268995 RepID=UPI003ECB2154
MKLKIAAGLILLSLALAEFIPTDDWQPISPDQKLPPGLHVRVNMETGEREAKIMSPDDKDDSNAAIVVDTSNFNDNGAGGLIEQALHEISTPTPNLEILEEVAEYAHDVEFGESVVNSRLLQALVNVLRSATSPNMKEISARILGAALRNNPAALQIQQTTDPRLAQQVVSLLGFERNSTVQERLVYLLSSVVGSESGLRQVMNDADDRALRSVFRQGSPAVRAKLGRFVSDHLVDLQNGPLEHISTEDAAWKLRELKEWSDLFQDAAPRATTPQEKLAVVESLVEIHRAHDFMPVHKPFLQWLATAGRDTNEPQELRDLISRVRHVVFGNPNAQRKHDAEDL